MEAGPAFAFLPYLPTPAPCRAEALLLPLCGSNLLIPFLLPLNPIPAGISRCSSQFPWSGGIWVPIPGGNGERELMLQCAELPLCKIHLQKAALQMAGSRCSFLLTADVGDRMWRFCFCLSLWGFTLSPLAQHPQQGGPQSSYEVHTAPGLPGSTFALQGLCKGTRALL